MSEYRYFLVESGELLEKCRQRIAEMKSALDAINEFVRQRGGEGFFPTYKGTLRAIKPMPGAALPNGWRVPRNVKKYVKDRWEVDLRTSAGRAEAKLIDELPSYHVNDPWNYETSKWIGLECELYERNHCNRIVWTNTVPAAQHITTNDHQYHAIVVPLTRTIDNQDKLAKYLINFPVPKGCREISAIEWRKLGGE